MTAAREFMALRIATLVIAPLLAWLAMIAADHGPLSNAATAGFPMLWAIMMIALTMRLAYDKARPGERSPAWEQFDVLTAAGGSMMWMSAASVILATLTGWASLSVIGMLGLAAVCLSATWTAAVAGGDVPWRRAVIERAILPALAVEGDPLREEVRVTDVRIPAGMRLFATGWTTLHGATTRYAVGSEASRAELKLESDLGPAVRGEHRAPPLTLWLGDTLGLTRTPVVHRGEASFLVLPRLAVVRGARALLGVTGDDATARPTQHQPTEGTFRIRDYAPGDDTRRIHWVRSLQTNGLVVRLPDEVPDAEPEVRLVLDNELRGSESLTCRAPHELLDALVRVWLGVARAIADGGSRVTLVAAVDHGGAITALARPMIARSPREAQRLGGRVTWQSQLPLATLVADHPTRQLIVSSRPRDLAASSAISWIVVPEAAWTTPEAPLPVRSPIQLPFPSGSADNRKVRQRRELRSREAAAQDRALFSQVMCWTYVPRWTGQLVARPSQGDVELAVIP